MSEEEREQPVSGPNEADIEGYANADDDFDDPAATQHGARPMKVVAVAGAKGGVGKSLLAANLGVYLATLGRSVLAVDADAAGASLHRFLGTEHPRGVARYEPPLPSFRPAPKLPPNENLRPLASIRHDGALPEKPSKMADYTPPPAVEQTDQVEVGDPLWAQPMIVPGLSLLHAGFDEPLPGRDEPTTRPELLEIVREKGGDYAVLDLGSGSHPELIDLWLSSDLPIFVLTPDTAAIENTYRFVRAAFRRFLLARDLGEGARRRLRDLWEGRRLAEGRDPAPSDVLRRLEDDGDPLAEEVAAAIRTFVFPFVINQTRLRTDLELGEDIESAARRRLGIRFDYLGYIDSDDTVDHCLRNARPLLVESPGTKASRNIEKIARRLLAIEAGKRRRASLPDVPAHSHHDLLEVDRGASDEEVRRAFKRMRELYSPGSLACAGLFDAAGLERLGVRVLEANDVLLDPARRRPYELSVFPQEIARGQRDNAPRSTGPRPPAPVITPETEFTGGLLRAVRESQGVELAEVSRTTRIGLGYLEAIEADDFRSLPAEVYVRGFVKEVARFLELDVEHVARSYVRRYAQQTATR